MRWYIAAKEYGKMLEINNHSFKARPAVTKIVWKLLIKCKERELKLYAAVMLI
jgi:hypothetical protein